MRIALLVLLLTSMAFADGRLAINTAGGLEGGTITGKPRPDAVLEVGGLVEWYPSGNVGLGATTTVVKRLTDTGRYEELRFDPTLRYARPDRKYRFGVGIGLRRQTDAESGAVIRGYDFLYLDGAIRMVGTEHFSLDFFYAWAFGCYSDTITLPAMGDVLAPKREVRCTDAMSTTYTVGIATSMSWR